MILSLSCRCKGLKNSLFYILFCLISWWNQDNKNKCNVIFPLCFLLDVGWSADWTQGSVHQQDQSNNGRHSHCTSTQEQEAEAVFCGRWEAHTHTHTHTHTNRWTYTDTDRHNDFMTIITFKYLFFNVKTP